MAANHQSIDDFKPRRESGENLRVLVVDDEELFRVGLEHMLRRAGFQVASAPDGADALNLIQTRTFDVLLVDVNMPRVSGPELLKRVKELGCTSQVVMMSGSGDIAHAVAAVRGGAFGFLTKPFVSDDAVIIELRNAAQTKQLHENTERLEQQLLARPPRDELLGRSPRMIELMRLITGVATTNSTILVLGESGTGKELVARAIHARSRRSGRPFVCVNCGALPPELVESELFGHARGAFTSAVSARSGLFEAANGGTLLLDEIGDLPMSAQVKLLRVLQEGEIKPVGSDQAKKVDVRVIAATNVDLKAAIAAGTFRQDLYYRLNVIPLHIPPLRERGEDVLFLAHHFLKRHAQAAGRGLLRLGDEVARRLQAHSWPGNVRELTHAMEHAVVFSTGDVVELSALPVEVRGGDTSAVRVDAPAPFPSASADYRGEGGMREFLAAHGLDALPYVDARQRVLDGFNEAYVKKALADSDGNISEAARRSGVDRSNFRRLMRGVLGHPGKPDTLD